MATDRPHCPHCHGTGMAPGDGPTRCGFCPDGTFTEEAEAERRAAWAHVFDPRLKYPTLERTFTLDEVIEEFGYMKEDLRRHEDYVDGDS